MVSKGYGTTLLWPALGRSQVVDYILALVALLRPHIGRTNTIKTGHNKRIIRGRDLSEGHLTWYTRSADKQRMNMHEQLDRANYDSVPVPS